MTDAPPPWAGPVHTTPDGALGPWARGRPERARRWPWSRARTGDGAGRPHRPAGRPPRRRPGRPPRRWRVVLWRARLPFAAIMVGGAAALALAELRPAPPPRTPVVVAARALDAGAPLVAGDLAVAHLPPDAVADGAHPDPGGVLGRTVVVAVPVGLPVVEGLLRDDRLSSAGPPGSVVVPVRLADPGVAELLRPGDRVDLFAAGTSASGAPVAERLAERALVLPYPAPAPDPGPAGLLGSGTADGDGRLTLVAVAPAQAAGLAGASAWAGISAVLVE